MATEMLAETTRYPFAPDTPKISLKSSLQDRVREHDASSSTGNAQNSPRHANTINGFAILDSDSGHACRRLAKCKR
jgi:hypothetical protein